MSSTNMTQELDVMGERLRTITAAHITKKESHVMVLIAKNWTVQQIAKHVCRSEKTIYKHIENAKRKLSCNSQSNLMQRVAACLGVMC